MSFMLFEVWTEDEIGHQELIDTTASESEAMKIAKECLEGGAIVAIVYQETEDGDSKEIARLT